MTEQPSREVSKHIWETWNTELSRLLIKLKRAGMVEVRIPPYPKQMPQDPEQPYKNGTVGSRARIISTKLQGW